MVIKITKGVSRMAMNNTEIISRLKEIVDSIGVEAFANHARAKALVSDYFPGYENEKTRKLIKSIINVDAFVKISSASNNDLGGVCKTLKTLLVDGESLSEDSAEMTVCWVCCALGKRKPNFSIPTQTKPRPQAHLTSNSHYTSTRQSTQQPKNVDKQLIKKRNAKRRERRKRWRRECFKWFLRDFKSTIALRLIFTIIMLCGMLGSVCLTPILLNYSGKTLIVVQCVNLLLILTLLLQHIVRRYDNIDDWVNVVVYFVSDVWYTIVVVILTALIVRSFVYLCGDIVAIINCCIIVIATIYAKVAGKSLFGYFFSGFWDYPEQPWLKTIPTVSCYCWAVTFGYVVVAIIKLIKLCILQ